FSEDRLSYVQKILGKPLGAHFKQLSKDSVYVKGSEEEFYLEPFAIPKNKEFAYGLFRQIFHHPHWNLSYVVHDWFSYMNDHHQAFRKIETAEAYFEGLDQALLDTPAACNQCGHLSLQLCMSQPHITMMSVGMQSVSHIRSTSDSKSFFVEGKKRWRWHLYSSLLIHSLGKYPFYDQRNTDPFNLTTNRHIEFELIWIALSGGPMGFGDRIGRENKELIYRFVRPNGEILRPDQVALPLDRCFWTNFEKRKMNEAATVVACSAIHNLHGRASYKLYYLLDMNISKTLKRAKTFYHFAEILEEDEIRKKQNYVLFDRRSEEIQVIQEDQALKSISGFRIYQYRCVAPIQKGFAFFGDCNKAVSASSQLFSQIHFEENTLRFTILRREKELSSRIVLYSKSSPNQVTIDGEVIPFIYQKEKVEFEINDGFVGQVTVCVTRK
ncbi:MAG: hypothetical protein JW708_06405, partial [Vallitaleaceae bacterium]|nr:hypothetical protein [Vallitaleaceae bacterium]